LVEIELGKTLNLNPHLSLKQKEQLINLLQEHEDAFAWEYTYMKRIHRDMCTHHIYIYRDAQPFRQRQRRMNPFMRDTIKEEIH